MNTLRLLRAGITSLLLMGVLVVPSAAASSATPSAPQRAGALASPSEAGLYRCAPSPSCNTKNARTIFLNYATVCSLSDCTFAAAANWEAIVLHKRPTTALVQSAYRSAHQTFNGGLHLPDLWNYWKTQGIDGAYLTKVTPWAHTRGAVQNAVAHFGSLMADLQVAKTSPLASQLGVYRTVIVNVDGFDSVGPLLAFRAASLQTTWSVWAASVRGAWGIVTSASPPVAPVPRVSATVGVAFAANGGSGTMMHESATLGETAPLALNAFVYSGFAFSHWSTQRDGSGMAYADGANFHFSSSITLYAQWTPVSSPVPTTLPAPVSTPLPTPTPSPSPTPTSSPSPTPTPAPSPSTTPFPGSQSTNWSGYVVTNSSYTSVSGKWTVPTLNCADTSTASSAIWVGIGGVTGDLLQTGTENECYNGVQYDYGWWELVPNNPNSEVRFPSNFTVSPGDTLQATVFKDGNANWETILNNLTTGLSGVMVTSVGWGVGPTPTSGPITFTSQGAAPASYSGGDSAEWIVEDPESAATGSLFPLANFRTVTFSSVTANSASGGLLASDGMEIVHSGVAVSVPGATDSSGNFTVTYTGP